VANVLKVDLHMDAWKDACLLSSLVPHADMKALVGTLAHPIMVRAQSRSTALGLLLVLKAAQSTIKALAAKTSVMNPVLLAPTLAPAHP